MEDLIQAIVRALGIGASLEDIRTACLEKGWTEEDIFLAYKAAENLYQAIQEQEKDLKMRPLSFGRKL